MDRTNGCANKTIPKIHLVRHRQVVGALNAAKRATIWAKWRWKIQNHQFWGQFSISNTVNYCLSVYFVFVCILHDCMLIPWYLFNHFFYHFRMWKGKNHEWRGPSSWFMGLYSSKYAYHKWMCDMHSNIWKIIRKISTNRETSSALCTFTGQMAAKFWKIICS